MSTPKPLDQLPEAAEHAELIAQEELLNRTFFALSDPIRRAILARLDGASLLVSELAEPFDVSLQAVSKHIQVLVRAGLVQQERSGRISRCSIEVAPIFAAAVWINRYSKYWQQQFDVLAEWLELLEERRSLAARDAAAQAAEPGSDQRAPPKRRRKSKTQ